MTADRAVVLLGFGGPASSQEIRPFLDRVLQGRPVPQERYEEVVRHYEIIGGKSPFNERTQEQARALEQELHDRGVDVPVCVAYRNAAPFIQDVAHQLARNGTQPVAVILAAHQSEAGWDRYYGSIPNAAYTPPFFDHPLFVRAHAERLEHALRRLEKTGYDDVALIFTAHSIPQSMADRGPYVQQLQRSAQLIADAAGAKQFTLAFQSRSGSPSESWLGPDVRDVLDALSQTGVCDAVVSPLGFLCDHVEVLYDLDVEAAAIAQRAGVRMSRAKALNDHPLFIRMLGDMVQACLA